MKYFLETTVWSNSTAPNHVYYLSDSKTHMVGYIKAGDTELFKFKNPIRIDTRGRKFKQLDIVAESDSVYFKVDTPESSVIMVEGSNGKQYQVAKKGARYTCSCPGFGFRQKCKHVDAIKESN
jgi:uncharacterized Zn finger protein